MQRPPHRPRTLLTLRSVVCATPDGGRIGPIDLALPRGSRVSVDCARPEQWSALLGLLTGRNEVLEGHMEEIVAVRVQTDRNLRELLNPKHNPGDWLRSPEAPEKVWIEGRNRALGVLVDRLGLSPHHTRERLERQPDEVQARYWALRFMVSQADLLLGREVFEIEDALVRSVFVMRWKDIPGTVITGAVTEAIPGPVHFHLTLDGEGMCSVERRAVDGAPGQ